ncbi:MAG: hypothetical protein HIU92_21630 [Proteobacteria bacterium]|nr:hypothetical protein [Pseudomonadota bacterium]
MPGGVTCTGRALAGAEQHGRVGLGLLLERLHQWGAPVVFGYSGDEISGLLGGMNRFGPEKNKFVQVRHEEMEMAAFMASAYAKFTGDLRGCLATLGPGGTHLITGMYDARMDHMPLLAIAGQQSRNAVEGHYPQELDPQSAFKASAWDEALASEVPLVLEVKTGPNVPPLPPRITREQEKKFTLTLLKGDPEVGSVLVNAAKEVLSSVLPGHRS